MPIVELNAALTALARSTKIPHRMRSTLGLYLVYKPEFERLFMKARWPCP